MPPDAHFDGTSPSVHCLVLTISDTRTPDTDTSGDAIVAALTAAGHRVSGRRIVRDEPADVRAIVTSAAGTVDAILTTGGTGLSSRDTTYETLDPLFDKRLDGFGEIFRMISFEDVGPAAMLSRACAGTIGRTIAFCLPGSEKAVRLAMTRLIIPELGHIVALLRK